MIFRSKIFACMIPAKDSRVASMAPQECCNTALHHPYPAKFTKMAILIEWLHSPHLDLKTGVSSGVAVAQRRPLRSIHFMPFPTKRMRHWLKPLVSFNEHNERTNLRERERETVYFLDVRSPGYLDSWCLQIKDLTRASSCEATY